MQPRERIEDLPIEREMRGSYLLYAMSVIASRALPDVRDGLKPSQRRLLVTMHDLGLGPRARFRKCAKITGDTFGNYHPLGEQSLYPTLVRLAQDFVLRYPLVEGQGNFGSQDGDPPAAQRYTEARMTPLTVEMLEDIDKDTVDFTPNYDDSMKEPSVLPTRIPCLLINGATGIAVGMATNMAPHNIGEVIDGIIAYIENPEIELVDLIKNIPGPDFPTGGIIYGRQGILSAYKTGRGKVVIRAKAEIIKDKSDREQIIVTEIPYMVNKSVLLEKMAALVREKTVEGISFLRDESDRKGMRIVIGIKKDNYAEIILNQLYKYTQLQNTFSINNLALVNLQPRQLNLKELIALFVDHRHDVVTRRTQYELNKARERAHILAGLRIALDNIDAIIALIKGSHSPEDALKGLMNTFGLSEPQAKAILDMRLQRLTGLEREKIEAEYSELMKKIEELGAILESREKRMEIIKEELLDIQKRYADPRRTEIVDAESDVDIEDMIADDDMVITMSHEGYIKRCPITTYRAQGRGGRGIKGMDFKDEDFIETIFVASAHSYILFFTSLGRCYRLKVYMIPEASRQSRGRSIVNILQLRAEETIAAFVPVKEFDDTHYVVMATEKGIINKQPLRAYANVRRDGINAIHLDDSDRLVECKLTHGDNDIILGSRNGMAVRFHESAVRELGRNTRGVKGITLRGTDIMIGMIIVEEDYQVLTVTVNGYGKRTPVSEYRKTNRGGTGIINIKCTDRNGNVIGLRGTSGNKDLMLITRNGIIIRSSVDAISSIGRNTQGVRLINLDKEDEVINMALCDRDVEKEEEENTQEENTDE
jgi:DNA gyrase subunit A